MAKARGGDWKKSKAKEMLKKDIMDGVVTDELDPKHVYDMRDEYKNYEYKNFKVNLQNLSSSIRNQKQAAVNSAAAYDGFLHHAQLQKQITVAPCVVPKNRTYPKWIESEAPLLIVTDIRNGKDKEMKPKDLWLTREEYQLFPLKVFRDHLYKEQDRKEKAKQGMKKRAGALK